MTRSVWESHKVYLLTRDMSTIAALAVLLFLVGMELAGVDFRTTLIILCSL